MLRSREAHIISDIDLVSPLPACLAFHHVDAVRRSVDLHKRRKQHPVAESDSVAIQECTVVVGVKLHTAVQATSARGELVPAAPQANATRLHAIADLPRP